MPEANGVVALPNGLRVTEINSYETQFLYKEIFVDNAYFQHGIALGNAPVIVDVGANIGLFSLYCLRNAPDARIFAFEPAPHCYRCLEANLSAFGESVVLQQKALLDTKGSRSFTYYPYYSLMSGVAADAAADLETLRRGVAWQLGVDPVSPTARKMVSLVSDRKLSDPVSFLCEGTTLSDIIKEFGIDRIDLLKIDVEKAEGQVLAGIEARDWPIIRQIVVEVHDLGAAEHVAMGAMLDERGFRTMIEASDALAGSALYNIYAARK